MHNWLSWFAIFWSTFHDFLYLGAYWGLNRIGVIDWMKKKVPWMAKKPRPLDLKEIRDEVKDAHQHIHALESRIQELQGGTTDDATRK